MFKVKNKLTPALLLFASVVFLFLFIGGEYLHTQIHHHNSSSSQEQCPFYQILVQLFIALITLFTLVALKTRKFVVKHQPLSRSIQYFNLPNLRAPPVSLIS